MKTPKVVSVKLKKQTLESVKAYDISTEKTREIRNQDKRNMIKHISHNNNLINWKLPIEGKINSDLV